MKKTKKNKAGKATLLGGAAKSLRKLGKGTAKRVGGLSTTQKVVGGAALVALGLNYLSKRLGSTAAADANGANGTDTDVVSAEANLAAMDNNA